MTPNPTKAILLGALALAIAAPAQSATKPAPAKASAVDPKRVASFQALGKLPDFTTGVWQVDWQSIFGAGGRAAPPQLTAEAAAKMKAYQEGMKRGENVQNENANCIPPGVPQIMTMPYPLEFIYSPDRVTIAIETDSQVRRIYTDGRKHPEDPDLTFNGDSIGHWEGDTLVADTVGLEPNIKLAPGLGHSDQVHIVEHFRLIDQDHMQVTTTIEDPKMLTQPWTVVRPYIRHADWTIQEYVCEQNNHDSADEKGRAGFRLDNEAAPKP
jgi:hypothetical protein